MELRVLPTVREADGLALSSRNRYLTPEQRQQAPAIWRALQGALRRIEAGERDPVALESALRQELAALPGARSIMLASSAPNRLLPCPDWQAHC